MIPVILALIVGGVAAIRVWSLISRYPCRGRPEAWVLDPLASVQTWIGVAAATFVVSCAFQGSLGSKAFGYSRATDVLGFGLLLGAFLVPVQLVILISRGDPAGRARMISMLAWLCGASSLCGPGLAFMLD